MNEPIVEITPDRPGCLAIACDLAHACRRHAVLQERGQDVHTIGTCRDGEGAPLFVPRMHGEGRSA